jgi:hypothetical protein
MRTTRANLRILAAAGCAAWVALGPATARADDPETVRARLAPRDLPAGAPWVHRQAAAPAWMPEEAMQRNREREAASVGQDYVADHLDTWLEDTPLEVVGRLRHTDLVLTGGGGGSGAQGEAAAVRPPGGLDVRVRLAEKVRVTVVRDDFRRDLLYDPLRNRMSMDLFRSNVGGPATGVALTETYRVDDGSSRLLLNLHHRLQ